MLLNEIVSNALDSMSLGENEFTKCYRIAQRCIRQMKWDFIGTIKSVDLPVLLNMTCKMPDDFVSERKISLVDERFGGYLTLTEDSKLSLTDALNKDRLTQPNLYSGSAGDVDFLSDMDLSTIGSLDSMGYRIDRRMNVLVLDPNFDYNQIRLEYIGSKDDGGQCDVPDMVSEAILYFVIWQYNFAKKGVSGYDKQNYENQYFNALRTAKGRISKITRADMYKASRP